MLHTLFYKILKNASKILHALQNGCNMQVFRIFLMHLTKIYAISMQHTKLLEIVSVFTFNKHFFWKSRGILVVVENCSMIHTRTRDSFNTYLSNFSKHDRTCRAPLCFSSAKDKKWEMLHEKLNCLWILL